MYEIPDTNEVKWMGRQFFTVPRSRDMQKFWEQTHQPIRTAYVLAKTHTHTYAYTHTHTHRVSFSLLSSFGSRGQVVTGGSDWRWKMRTLPSSICTPVSRRKVCLCNLLFHACGYNDPDERHRHTQTHTMTFAQIHTTSADMRCPPSFSEVMNADEVVKGITGVRHKGVRFNNDVQWGGKYAASLFFLLLLNLLQR